jgi:fructose-1,6-bisphosphatase/inositol monophosphatase family enzyme
MDIAVVNSFYPAAGMLIRSVDTSGKMIKGLCRTPQTKVGEGHRSIITKADRYSNEYILSCFLRFPRVRFMCEEESSDSRALSKENPVGIFSGDVAVVDSLDGTTLFAIYFPEWCVGAGLLQDGIVTATVITAPQVNGGMTLFGFGEDLYLAQMNEPSQRISHITEKPPRECVILRGVDTELYSNITSLMPKIAASVRGVYVMGSGHFGLMSVALGRAAAIIQTPQKPWDWVPGYHAITKLGGIFRFFRLEAGRLIPVERYDERAFKLGKENRLGFVAGEPVMVEKLFAMLPRSRWERHDPDMI